MVRALALLLSLIAVSAPGLLQAHERDAAACISSETIDTCWDRLTEATLGALAANRGEEARDYADKAYELAKRSFTPGDPRIGFSLNNMGLVRRGDEAVDYYRQAIALLEPAGVDPGTLSIIHRNLGNALFDLLRSPDAEAAFATSIDYAVAAADYERAVRTWLDIAAIRRVDGRLIDAERALDEAMALAEEHLGTTSANYASVLRGYGRLLTAQARYEEARPYLERAVALLVAAYGTEAAEVLEARQSLVAVLNALGDPGAATQVEEISRVLGTVPADPALLIRNRFDLASKRFLEGDPTAIDEIVALAQEFAALPVQPRLVKISILQYTGIFLHLAGRHGEEQAYRDKARQAARELPATNPDRLSLEAGAGLGYFDDGEYPASLATLRSATAGLLAYFSSQPSSPALDSERRRKGTWFEYLVRSAWFAAQDQP